MKIFKMKESMKAGRKEGYHGKSTPAKKEIT